MTNKCPFSTHRDTNLRIQGKVAEYRPDILPIPTRLLSLPVLRGYPVPWFVAEVNGERDFRIISRAKIPIAVKESRCWICGQQLGKYVAFNGGAICGMSQLSAEPPAHKDCAVFAAKACPFLNQQLEVRRVFADGMPEGVFCDVEIQRLENPGIAMVWVTTFFNVKRVITNQRHTDTGTHAMLLMQMGPPTEVLWFKEGRPATQVEVATAVSLAMVNTQNLFQGPEGMIIQRKQADQLLAFAR